MIQQQAPFIPPSQALHTQLPVPSHITWKVTPTYHVNFIGSNNRPTEGAGISYTSFWYCAFVESIYCKVKQIVITVKNKKLLWIKWL